MMNKMCGLIVIIIISSCVTILSNPCLSCHAMMSQDHSIPILYIQYSYIRIYVRSYMPACSYVASHGQLPVEIQESIHYEDYANLQL